MVTPSHLSLLMLRPKQLMLSHYHSRLPTPLASTSISLALLPTRITNILPKNAIRTYTTSPSLPPPPKPKQVPPKNINPSYGAASFKDLGATKTVKIVVLVAISIMATAETITYGTWGWRKYESWKKGDGEA